MPSVLGGAIINADVPQKPYTASTRQIYAWAIGGIASHALIGTFGQAYNIFTIGFGLSAVLVSWAMMLPRVFDALTDPFMGHLSDNTHTRWGRRKPYLVGASVCGAGLVAALYWADSGWPQWVQFTYLLTLGTLFYFCYGLYTMAWTALGYELTDDYHERARVAAISSFFISIVLLGNQWLYWIALRPIFGNEVHGIRVISAVMALIIVIAAIVTALLTKERFVHANEKKHAPIFVALRETLHNRPFVILLLVKFSQILGERVFGGILVFVSVYYVCRGDKSLSTYIAGIGALIGTIWGFVLVPFMKMFSQKLGKRNGLVIPAVVAFVSACAMPFLLTPNHPYLMLLPSFFIIPLVVISNTMQQAIVPDICDLDELKTGERREGLFTAVMGFVAKLEISLTVLIVGYLVRYSGFDPKLPAQPDHVITKLLWLALTPNILFTFVTVILATRFRMDASMMNDVRRQLDERRASAAASAANGGVSLNTLETDTVKSPAVLGAPAVSPS
jgi:GPH family glycoside/pentoside/hexuronide:cation symporter